MPTTRLLCCLDKHSLCFGLCVEAPCKFTAWYMTKDGEKLSEMLGIQFQHILTSQKSPEVMRFLEMIFASNNLPKEISSKLIPVRKGRLVDCMLFCRIGTVIVMPVKCQL
ncbi:hypothetical protein VPH35_011551 [Triticum aestivum]